VHAATTIESRERADYFCFVIMAGKELESRQASPYVMCCREECEDRQRSGEVSIFEATANTVGLPIKQRRIDLVLAVSKYRRSAAGHTVHYDPRSFPQIEATLNHMIELLVTQKAPSGSVPAISFMNTVQFFDDRIRALQVDLVKTQFASKELQSRLARCHILILYLLADEPSYNETFGQTALHTALSSYWNHTGAESTDDEILSYMAICQCSQYLQQEQKQTAVDESFTSSVLSLYRKYLPQNSVKRLPLFQWTLQFTARISLGHWMVAIHMLDDKEGILPEYFRIFARCCFAKAMAYIRWKALQTYNTSFRKEEPVMCQEVARLLCLTDRRRIDDPDTLVPASIVALELGQASGLPVENESLIFKSAASLKDLPDTLTKRDDGFTLPACAIQWKYTSGTSWDSDNLDLDASQVARQDTDGVLIPPATWMREIILANTADI
jgi:hypothetical protein